MYPALCSIFQKHGYALAVHGSMIRDFDLIAVPWTNKVSSPESVVSAIVEERLAARITGDPELKPHGRLAYTLVVGFGECQCDLSFMPHKK